MSQLTALEEAARSTGQKRGKETVKNVKDEVFAALQAVCDNVSDVYPTSWVDLPAIQYTEEENSI